MNSLSGHIKEVKVNGSLSLVAVTLSEEVVLQSIVIETPDTAAYLKIGTPVNVLFKETEVVIGIGEHYAISLQNSIRGTVKTIEKGALISKVVVKTKVGDIASIISTDAAEQLGLKKEMQVTAMVKLNEIMLAE